MWQQYKRKGFSEMRPYVEGEVLPPCVSISDADLGAGSPKLGDMIARNPKNHEDQWLVDRKYFEDNLELVKDAEILYHRDMTEEDVIREIKSLRVDQQRIKELLNAFRNTGLSECPVPYEELTLALRASQQVRHWLGEALAVIGNATPYPDADDPSNTKIAPTADTE